MIETTLSCLYCYRYCLIIFVFVYSLIIVCIYRLYCLILSASNYMPTAPKLIRICKYLLIFFKHFRENSITISGLDNEKTGKNIVTFRTLLIG